MALINATAIPSADDFEIDQSLRFNDDDSAYLSRTPSVAGNRRTWTFSCWFKWDGKNDCRIFQVGASLGTSNYYGISSYDGKLNIEDAGSHAIHSTALFRDPSAWYHIVLAMDTTQSTASNRVKIYINGEQVTDFSNSATYPAQNNETAVNRSGITHAIGAEMYAGPRRFMDGYIAEVNLVDGQALTPSDFGETGTYGEWKPIEYSGTYGTNGFYLPFKQDYTVEGFSTVTYKGNGGTQYIGGTGFQPDFTWQKRRDGIDSHVLTDSIRGTDKSLYSDRTDAEASPNPVSISAFNSDGFTLGANGKTNGSGETVVAWCWDMGGSNATNTDGSITSTVRANPTYGQSIVSYTGNATAGATVGHGLSSAPEMIILKNRESSVSWNVYHASNTSAPETEALALNTTDATSDYLWWNDTAPTSSVFSLGAITNTNANNTGFIAYCFHSVTGYSKIGSFDGTGSATAINVNCGFEPAFLLWKVADASSGRDWYIIDNVRTTDRTEVKNYLTANTSNAEVISTSNNIAFTSTGFTVTSTNDEVNSSGDKTIYMAFADKREYAYWLDQSGNNNDWTSNNLTESDISVDSPTNNFATLNPLDSRSASIAEGNLQNTPIGSNHWSTTRSTIAMPSGSWYAEFYAKAGTGNGNNFVGIATQSEYIKYISDGNSPPGTSSTSWAYSDNDNIYNNGSIINNTGITWVTGDIIGVTFTGTVLKFYKNNSLVATISSIPVNDYCFITSSWTTSMSTIANFGQDSSFAGNKTAQGNQDGNSIGDFYYTPPSGFLALCTKNLPDVAVVPSEHFNTVLYSGTGSNQDINGVGFRPDFVWAKDRTLAHSHMLTDKVRGIYKTLNSNSTESESSLVTALRSFNSDGFSLGSNANINDNGNNFVAWNWKANGSGSSNTNGTITSTVSANTDAGFSIVSYTGSGTTGDSVGHGLGAVPDSIFIKSRTTQSWNCWFPNVSSMGATKMMQLNNTGAASSQSWLHDTMPTSSVFYLGAGAATNAQTGYIAYCFKSVDGYSKVGSYTGNGSTDGTFVYTSFAPAYILWKNITDAGTNWVVFDNKRDTYNPNDDALYPNASTAEEEDYDVDFLSNGFKFRNTSSWANLGSKSYIYIAFAETPFKYSNAR